VINTHGLTKRFGSVVAVDDVDLDVQPGDRYGFLGPNGSGKTTTVRMLLGLIFASSGTAEVMGHEVPRGLRHVLPQVGSLVEGPAAYPHLSGRTNLTLMDAAGSRGGRTSRRTRRRRVEDALELVGLASAGRKPTKAYSLGMRQRLGIAAALLRAPELLILDEPTNGLDPQGIREIRDLLLEMNKQGTTLFVSSHLLAEVEQLCTRVGVLDRGRLVLQDSLQTLQAPTGRVAIRTPDVAAAVALLDGRVESRDGDQLLVRGRTSSDLVTALVGADIRVVEVVVERPRLEDVVLAVTGAGSDRPDSAAPGPGHDSASHEDRL
jgi:ABC-2 type transport system ATP-binding protein